MRNIIPTLLTAVALLFTACDNGYDCNLENTAYNRIGFYSNQDSITGKYRFIGYRCIHANNNIGDRSVTLGGEIGFGKRGSPSGMCQNRITLCRK